MGSAAYSGEITGTDYADYLRPGFDSCTIISGAGDDTIESYGANNIIYAGEGNDSVSLQTDLMTYFSSYRANYEGDKNIICFGSGDGNDTVLGFEATDTLSIAGNTYSTQTSGNDIIVKVDGDSMILVDAASLGSVNIEYTKTATTPAATTATATPIVSGSYVYAGGDQVISNYAGEQITLGTAPTGAFFGGGNFALTSATGTLLIQNANDKLISFTDGAGNPYAKAYAATNPGVIDGRGLTGYEVINGSDLGGDVIYAGDGGSQLWGGNGNDADVLTGGGGTDIFVGGRTQGADIFFNASSADVVNLNDATLSDIVAAAESNGVIALAFNTGSTVAVQSSELLSSAFVLADGSAYRYNHVTQSWQGA